MNKIKEAFINFKNTLILNKGKIPALIFAVVFTSVFFIDTNFLHGLLTSILWIILLIVLVLLISWLFLQAGFTVLKSFFLMSAELSLLIFLAQEYCKTPNHTADDALVSLVGLSILYISYNFFVSLKEALSKKLDSIPEKRWGWEKIVVVILFLSYTVLFIYAIFRVIRPIIMNLCVFCRV